MFAGGRLKIHAPLQIGGLVNRESRISATAIKQGRSGEMLFVTVRHTYGQDGAVRIIEEQDLVYRSDSGGTTPFTRVDEPLRPPFVPWWTTPVTDPTLLFRFSALTGNAHRIHYDEPYSTGTEGYPGLVVHGPLLAVYMAGLVRANAVATIREFTFRLHRPRVRR
jgi:3-methylfumaryl-CoA hydratase